MKPKYLALLLWIALAAQVAIVAYHQFASKETHSSSEADGVAQDDTRQIENLKQEVKGLNAFDANLKTNADKMFGLKKAPHPVEDRRVRANSIVSQGTMAALAEDATASRAMWLEKRQQVDQLYAEFFSHCRLTPEQIDKLRDYLTDFEMAKLDVQLLSHKSAPNATIVQASDFGADQLVTDMKALLGDNRFGELTTYAQTLPARAEFASLSAELNFLPSGLDAQLEKALQDLWLKNYNVKASSDSRTPVYNTDAILQGSLPKLSPEQQNIVRRFLRTAP